LVYTSAVSNSKNLGALLINYSMYLLNRYRMILQWSTLTHTQHVGN